MKSVPAIAFDYRPSRWLSFLVVAVAVLAFVSIVSCGLNAWLKFGLVLATAAYALHSMRKLLRPVFVQIAWHPAGHWRLGDADGHEQTGELARAAVLGALLVLAIRTSGKRMHVFVLLPDNCDGETRRRLRLRLARADSIVPRA